MKNIDSKDQKFLLLSSLVTVTLIIFNIPLFLKTLAANKLATPEIKKLSNQAKISGLRKNEQEIWNKIKEINLEQNDENEAEIKPEKPQIKLTSNVQKTNNTPITQPYEKFLLLGDSNMYDLSPFINYDLRKIYQIKNVRLDYKVSTGLNRVDFYDWYVKTPEIITSYKPDVLTVIFGANDDQDILDSQGKYNTELSEDWKKTYRERVEKYAKLVCDSSVKKIYWIGQPMSNIERYNKFYLVMNEIYRDVVKNYPKIEFIDTWSVFAINGKFAPIISNKFGKKAYVRPRDGVHFTEHGSQILSDLILDKMLKDKVIIDKNITLEIAQNQQKNLTKTQKTNQPYGKFLLIGDSTMSDLSPVINYDLRKLYYVKNVRLDDKVSTGLNRTDFYDWYAKTTESITSYQPDVLMVIFGANDAQDIVDDQGKSHPKFTEEWKQTYRERVERYAKLVSDSSVKKIYWIGQPMSNINKYNKFYPLINEIYRDVVKNYPKIQFIETWDSFTLNGKFASILPNKLGIKAPVRLNDGVHFSEHGATIIADLILDKMITDKVITNNQITSQTPPPQQKPEQKIITKVEKPSESYERFLLIGDSIMYDLGTSINYNLRKSYQVKNIKLSYKVSTGLNRIDFYDWYAKTPPLIQSYQPDVLIVIFGGNDDQDILDYQGKYHVISTEGWKNTYRERVERYAKLVSDSSVKKVYWIGHPISNVGRFNKFFPIVNEIYRDVIKDYPKIEFVDTWDTFAIDGKFSPIIPNKSGKKSYVRISDGVHYTEHGANILGDFIIDKMADDHIIK